MPLSGLSRLLATGLLVGPLHAGQPDPLEAFALKALADLKPALGLDQRTTFAVRRSSPDPVLGGTDVRIDQYHQGVRVLGGEAILHLRAGQVRTCTDAMLRHLSLDTHPALTPSEALAVAVRDLAPHGPFARPPSCELLVAQLPPATRAALVYQVHTELENGTQETAHTDYLIDAWTGSIARKWNSLETAATVGSGQSQYSGGVTINTNSLKDGYELRDLTRGQGGNVVLDAHHAETTDGGKIYQSATDTWGDGKNYEGGSTTSANGQTAAVDAAYGLQWTWDYYQNIHQRKGIDGKGRATSLRVHYGTGYDNAFWEDTCFCMTFGDGTNQKSFEAMDVMAHEMSHGVCSTTAGLVYLGESGGLNESNSDINGVMVKFYAHSPSADRIGDQGADWVVGEDLETADHPEPIRYMYKPSKDGFSADSWKPDLGLLDVHESSGPMNRCFFFLSHGASPDKVSDFHTDYLAHGMAGVGNDKAAHIWYRAMTTYLTSLSGYADARKASISAAQDLYGKGGAEEAAVWNAFHGINVGDAWPGSQRHPGPTGAGTS